MDRNLFEIPSIVTERYGELVDLIENKSVDRAHVAARDLAEYLRVDVNYLRSVIQTGRLPYAFAPQAGRSVSYIGVLPLFLYETQAGVTLLKK